MEAQDYKKKQLDMIINGEEEMLDLLLSINISEEAKDLICSLVVK